MLVVDDVAGTPRVVGRGSRVSFSTQKGEFFSVLHSEDCFAPVTNLYLYFQDEFLRPAAGCRNGEQPSLRNMDQNPQISSQSSYLKTQPCNSLVIVSTDGFVLISIIIVICLKMMIK